MLNKTLYISSMEAGVGSLMVSIGVMHALKKRYAKVAFYRPIIASREGEDSDIRFMIDYFGLKQSYNDSFSLALDEMAQIIVTDGRDALIARIIKDFKALESAYDFVLMHGFDRAQLAAILGFPIGVEIAQTLNAPMALIVSGKNKSVEKITQQLEAFKLMAIQDNAPEPIMIFINRVDEGVVDDLKAVFAQNEIMYVIPESKELEAPTIRAVKDRLNCKLLIGDEDMLDKNFSDITVAAMEMGHYLERIKNNDLVIVPGDRVDILLASLASYYSKDMPHIAAIVLSGGIVPPDIIVNMLKDFNKIPLPILVAQTDTYHTVKEIENLPSKMAAKNERKISLALGLFNASIEGRNFESKLGAEQSSFVMTPTMFEYSLFERARADKKTIVLDETEDERILRAVEILLRLDVVNIVLLGVEQDINHKAGLLGLDISKAKVIDPVTSVYKEKFINDLYEMRKAKGITLDLAKDTMEKSSYFGVMMIQEGLADGMVSGATHTTAETVRPALQIVKTKPGISIVSSVFFMCLDTKVLVYGDCAIIPDPTEQELAEIAISAADTATAFGLEPKVAMLSYSTGSSGTGADVDKVRNATKLAQDMRPDLAIDGPMQYDAATDPIVGKSKAPNSKVAGEANVLIFPDLNAGNNAYKAVQRSSGAIAIGPVLQGLKKPVNDLSRGCLVKDIVNTVAITALQAQQDGIK